MNIKVNSTTIGTFECTHTHKPHMADHTRHTKIILTHLKSFHFYSSIIDGDIIFSQYVFV